ncbi:poly(ADP-ribose) polymerase family member 14-related sequence 1 isoform X2 [Misgurnus anguillicaudatus]|uniref:poly(ADP-ribose) polymerase family member 14-related sequence 1 isoform X2 n=1 Tax=Misgurnus anguillicaudatus TaxID=75329 RepID=UPI003CCF4254
MADEFPYVLLVEGQWDPKLKNKITIYFQSKNKSGGGNCVVELDTEGRKGTVRFKDEEARQRVLQKQTHELKIGQQTVKMTVSLPPSEVSNVKESTSLVNNPPAGESKSEVNEEVEGTEEEEDGTRRQAVIENIQNSNQEFLQMLVENILKETPAKSKDINIEVIQESNCAVVTFSCNKDTENFILSASCYSLIKKKQMRVRILETTLKVKAEALPVDITSDYLGLYFDKFGDIEDNMVISEKEHSAIITFKDPAVFHTVIKSQHVMKKQPFRVLPYYESLQTALYGKNRPSLTLPEALTENVDPTIWRHLNKNKKSLDLINKAMSTSFCKLDFGSQAVKITPLPSLLQQGGQTRKLIQSWREDTSSLFSESMSRFKSFELLVQKDAWSEIEPEIQEAVAAVPVTLVPNIVQGAMAVVGLKEDVNRIESDLKEIVERITQKIQREKGSETDNIDMPPSIYQLIVCHGLKQQILNKFPEMEINYHENNKKLALYGLRNEVLETKNAILQDVVSLIRRPVEVHQSVLDFLRNSDLEKMTKSLFFTKGIDASLEADGDRVLLIGKTESDIKNGQLQLKTELGHLSFDVEDAGVLTRLDWQDLVSNIKNKESGVTIQTTVKQVLISGLAQVIHGVEKQLRDFVIENSNIEKTLKAHKTVIKFIKQHRTKDWFEDVKGKVNVQFKDDIIVIDGPRLHVSQYVPLFEKLLTSTHHCVFKVAKPGAKKFFKEKESMWAPLAKNDMDCLVELVDEDNHLAPVKPKIKSVYEFKTPDGVEITVNKADMCSFKVDAIVCGSNEALLLDGGLAKALSNADDKLQDACDEVVKAKKLTISDAIVLDAGGRLLCKHVIFALAPHFNTSNYQDSVSLLGKTVRKSLNLAEQENCQSVAIPAIGSGAFGFPPNLCAETIVKSIKKFCDIIGGNFVTKQIHLVDNNDTTVQAFQAAVQKIYGVSASSNPQQGQSQASSSQSQASSSQSQVHRPLATPQGSSPSVQTKEGLTITLKTCNIEDTTMDVVVNTLSSDLNLGVGAVSNALLKAAGPQLQVLVNQQATAPVNIGTVIVTAGANLKNKLVFHAVAPHYNQGTANEQKVLENIIDECLNQAEQRQQKSIIFSAIGTGNLGFPKDVVIGSMLDLALKFSSKRSTRNVQVVAFALHPKDAQTIQVFTDEFNKKFAIQTASANNPTQQTIPGPFSKVTTVSGVHETTVGGIKFQVLSGDITAEKTAVIVNSSNKDFTLKAGVSKAILDKAGPNVEAECQQLGSQPNKGYIMTQAGNLQCKKIIHIAAQSNAVHIEKIVKRALEKCAKERFTSISFPAIGTGQGGLSPGQAADAMMDAVVNMVRQSPQSSLKLIRIVVFQAPMLIDFYKSMQSREYTIKQQDSTLYAKIKTYVSNVKSYLTGSWEKEVKQHGGKDFVIEGIKIVPASFSICGPTPAAVDRTKTFLEDMITPDHVFQKITDTAILSFSDKDQQQIQDMQSTLDVSIKLEYKAKKGSDDSSGEATLIVEGLSRDVLIASHEIQDMLKKAKEDEILKKDIGHTSELVDWQYEQAGQYKSFDPHVNFELEKALSGGDTDIKISIQGQDYKVKMPEGPAVSTTGGNQMNIRRIDKLKATESIPQHWSPMNNTDLFKRFILQTTDPEYNDVLTRFRATCPNNNVLKIERIQNPGMWKNYQNNKSVMEVKNGHQNNEKRLFHGTSEQTINHINKSGFNRSYAGKNAAAFGNGTYFALNASYSANNTYSVPNAQGQKHMYLCRVLTGDYTRGSSGMIVPPAKNTTTADLYDTVVDNPAAPSIFVVFRDDNAYPEYLITFT